MINNLIDSYTSLQRIKKADDTEKELNYQLKILKAKLTRYFPCTPFVPGDAAEKNRRCEQILSIQANGLKGRLDHTKSNTAVLGISGGLDSTLALLVTIRAFDLLGKDRADTKAVTMPCFGTTNRTYDNACKLTKALSISFS